MTDQPRDWLGRPHLDWSPDGTPRSLDHDDIYYSPEDGLAESRHVFLDAVGGPALWNNRPHTVIAETGFGTGLNFLATWQAWRSTRKPGQHLTFISVEGYPLTAQDLRRAHAVWPELQNLSSELTTALPPAVPGFHVVDLSDNLRLLLLYGDAGHVLSQLDAQVNAWYLDGFAPARNADLWSDRVMTEIRRLSAPGAILATFTAAGAVRRALSALGFDVIKAPGFGRKRERITATLPGTSPDIASATSPVILGNGIAGRLLHRALRHLGVEARIVAPGPDRNTGGSENPLPMVTPRLTLDHGAYGLLQDQTYLRALRFYGSLASGPEDIWLAPRGALAVAREAEDTERQKRQIAFANWPCSLARLLSPDEARALAGRDLPYGAISFSSGGGLNKQTLIDTLWSEAEILWPASAVSVEGDAGHWSIRDSNGLLAETDCLIIAAGPLSTDFVPMLRPATARVLGQVDFIRRSDPGPALTFGSYLSPSVAGEHGERIAALGATFNREAAFQPGETAPADSETATNFRLLSERLFGQEAEPTAATAWAAWRLTTRDRLPFVGGMGKGRFIMTGLGSRGFTYAPLLADMLAAVIAGAPIPVRRDIKNAIAPNRFAHLV